MKRVSKVFNHYTTEIIDGKTIYKCNYCHKVYVHRNATKFAVHINKCKNAPENVRIDFTKSETKSIDLTNNQLNLLDQSLQQLQSSTSASQSQDDNEVIYSDSEVSKYMLYLKFHVTLFQFKMSLEFEEKINQFSNIN